MSVEAFLFLSLYVGLIAYLGLAIFFLVGLLRGFTGRVGLIAAAATALWIFSFQALGDHPLAHILEITAYFCWILLLSRILDVSPRNMRLPEFRVQTVLTLIAGAVFVITAVPIAVFGLTYEKSMLAFHAGEQSLLSGLPISGKLALSLLGIVMLEQVARNTRSDYVWNIKFITIGLATIFVYGFVLYAEAMLFQAVSMTLLAPQAMIFAAAAPLIAIGSLRNRENQLSLSISRRFVFRTSSIILTGSYLLIMSAAGYYVQIFGGQWADVFLVVLIAAGAIGLSLLALSTTLRRWLRFALITNLYQYKYDYREEWLRLNKALTTLSADDSLGVRAIRALAEVISASSGGYWRLTERGLLVPCAQFRSRWNRPLSRTLTAALVDYYHEHNWIVDLDEYCGDSGTYPGLHLDCDNLEYPKARLIVPLFVEDRLFGLIMLSKPDKTTTLNWEDFDILKMIAQQVAGFLALKHLDDVLSESEQLRMMHQLSAFVVHDLKTVSAQMGLLLRNAEKHKEKPGFVDDMISTVRNSSAKVERLLAQLRAPESLANDGTVNLVHLVEEAVGVQRQRGANLSLDISCGDVPVEADSQKLASVIGHVIQNAQDAVAGDGEVVVRVSRDCDWAVVEVADDGEGMTEHFIANELFTPFVTTKGVAGIGIGAYQTREYVRSLGGDVQVKSSPAAGTRFTLRIPLASALQNEPHQ
jgi:putative PEP-CTERM system histidine kinase